MMVETDNDVVIRSARPEDAVEIARVHVASWKSAHAGVLPTEYLDTLGPESRLPEWRRILSEGSGTTIVAEADGRTLGFASYGPSRDEDADDGDLELYAIYLDPEAWGRGVARDLMRTVLADVPPGTRLSLWVPATSERARHFYRRHGFHPDGVERIDEVGGTPVGQVRYRRG
jgi:GNAT superfamily N-acetyltransferase